MNWDELESIMYRYWVGLAEPKIDYTQWWYGDGGIKETLQTYHIDKKPKPSARWEREITYRPVWQRYGGD